MALNALVFAIRNFKNTWKLIWGEFLPPLRLLLYHIYHGYHRVSRLRRMTGADRRYGRELRQRAAGWG